MPIMMYTLINAEPSQWWKLGNLKNDGIDKIMRSYINETPPAMKANRSVPVNELVKRYGDTNSNKLYDESDLICRFMHQWGEDSISQ